jgi:replication fork clamp-binding protein CrfC
VNLLEKRRQLDMAADTIHRLETRVRELEDRLREITGFSRSA